MPIFHFWRSPLAPKDAPLFKDVEFAIAWKNNVTQVTALLHSISEVVVW